MQSPDPSVESSSNDLMMAAPAITHGGGASSSATGAMNPHTGFIPISEEHKALTEWATNYHEQATREHTMAKAQMQHLVGVIGESKKEASGYQKENILMTHELGQAKALIQSECSSAQSILQEHTASCRSLDLAQQQLAHLAQRANEATLAYEFKDDELKIHALDNEKVIKGMNEQADFGKTELARQLQVAFDQCQHVVTNATEAQRQAQAKIAMALHEHQCEK